ncbi:MAG: hypothetical protein ACETWT_02290 [Thermodesulfobacteriota bacterium]
MVRGKLVAIAFVFLMVVSVFSVAPVFSITVSADPVSFGLGGFKGGPFKPRGDPVPGGGSSGGDD